MKKLMTAAAAAALLAASSFAAFAAEVTGAITSIDVAAGTIVLDDGKTYQLPTEPADMADLKAFKAGDKVKITFEDVDGKLTVSKVEAAAT